MTHMTHPDTHRLSTAPSAYSRAGVRAFPKPYAQTASTAHRTRSLSDVVLEPKHKPISQPSIVRTTRLDSLAALNVFVRAAEASRCLSIEARRSNSARLLTSQASDNWQDPTLAIWAISNHRRFGLADHGNCEHDRCSHLFGGAWRRHCLRSGFLHTATDRRRFSRKRSERTR
jgi:hypothetical protein